MDFTTITSFLKIKYTKDSSLDMWANSEYKWIRDSSTCKKGKIGEDIIKIYHSTVNDNVHGRFSIENDLVINESPVEVKLSCLNKSGYFKWLQIRLNDNYDYLYLLSIYPNDIKMYKIPKLKLIELNNLGILKNQHGGSRNKYYDIKYLGIKGNSIPDWLIEYEIKNN